MQHSPPTTNILDSQQLAARLQRHPELQSAIGQLLQSVENATGEASTADAVEELVVAHVQTIGQQALQAWAQGKETRLEQSYEARAGFQRRGKKNSGGRRASAL